jgi:amino acid permease
MIKPHNFELMEASPTGDSLSNSMTVFGLLNGMIGGPILLLPLIGISTGYVTTILICFTLGFISYFTANLIVVHLGKAKNMQECVYEHFDKNYSYVKAYSLIIWCGNIPLLIIYFKLICLQLEGLIGEHSWISIVIALALLVGIMLVVHFDIGE